MNNGLHGRYLEQLEAWNEAREVASELVTAFNEDRVSKAVNDFSGDVNFPSLSDVKSLLVNVMFLDGRDTIDQMAREIMEWGTVESSTTTKGHPAAAA